MAEKAVNSDESERGVVDLQNDARWQERLAVARERRARALKDTDREDSPSRQPRKPWEETTPASLPSTARPKSGIKKDFDFLDRMSVLKRVTGRDTKAEIDASDRAPQPGQNWYPGAGDGIDQTPAVDVPKTHNPKQNPAEAEMNVRPKAGSQTPVDAIFDEPTFEQNIPEAPVSLLLQPTEPAPPSSQSRPWLARQDDDIEVKMSVPIDAPIMVSDGSASKAKRRSVPGWISVAALALVAIAVGPLSVYAPWQERAIGPASPLFGLEPALGHTSPLIGFPQATSATNWRPASNIPPIGPLRIKPSLPPKFLRVITPFDILPQFGANATGAKFPPPAVVTPVVPRTAPVSPRLTLSMFERISGDPTRLVALPLVLAGVSFDAIKPVPRPETVLFYPIILAQRPTL
jgi:hypothetical protein